MHHLFGMFIIASYVCVIKHKCMNNELIRLFKICRSCGSTATRALQIARIWIDLHPTTEQIMGYIEY